MKMTVDEALEFASKWGPVTTIGMPAAMVVLAEEVRRLRAAAPIWTTTDIALPDDDETVLIRLADGEVWTGFVDAGQWRYVSADPVGVPVTHWASMPAGPTT